MNENIEKTLAAAKQYQIEAMIRLMQQEQNLRSVVHTAIDESLTFLGKGVVFGRKLSEAFSAQTHRRAEKLKKIEEAFDSGFFNTNGNTVEQAEEQDTETFDMSAEPVQKPEPALRKSQKQMKKLNRKSAAKNSKLNGRRVRAHSGAIRSH